MSHFSLETGLNVFFCELKGLLGQEFKQLLDQCEIKNNTSKFSRLTATGMNRLCNALNITLETISSGDVDLNVVIDHLSGGDMIPSRYVKAVPYSSRFTSIYMLNFLRTQIGVDAANFIGQRFQVKECHFTSAASHNNLLLPYDICNYVLDFYGEDLVERMGESSFSLLQSLSCVKNLNRLKNPAEVFDQFIYEISPRYVEKNFNWTIDRMASGFLQVSGVPKNDVAYELRNDLNRVKALEILRLGFIKSLPKLFGSDQVEALQTKSISAGHDRDVYVMTYKQTRERFVLLQ